MPTWLCQHNMGSNLTSGWNRSCFRGLKLKLWIHFYHLKITHIYTYISYNAKSEQWFVSCANKVRWKICGLQDPAVLHLCFFVLFFRIFFFSSGHLCWFSHVGFPSLLYPPFIVLFSLSDFLFVQLWTVFVLFPSSPFFDSFLSLLLTAWTNVHGGFNCSRHSRLSTSFLKVFSFPSSDIWFYMLCLNQYRYSEPSLLTCLLNTV